MENKKVKALIDESSNFLKREKIIKQPSQDKSWQYIMIYKLLIQ